MHMFYNEYYAYVIVSKSNQRFIMSHVLEWWNWSYV